MIKILTTGSNGLLGQKITKLVLEKYANQINLIASSRGPNRLSEKEGYQYISLDITNPTEVNKIISLHKPDFIINTAAATNVDWCEDHQEECWKANVTAVQNLIEACKQNNTHLVHVSTDFVFDGKKEGLYKEEDTVNPLSFYAKSKVQAEIEVQKATIKWAILRTVLVYGIVDDMSRSNVVLWAKKNLENHNQINVVDDQFRTPTLAEDLAKGCILACIHHAQGLYNISGKDYMNIYDLVHRVAQYFKLDQTLIKRVSSNELNQTAKRPLKTGFDLSKSKHDLGYEPLSFEEGLAILEKQINLLSV